MVTIHGYRAPRLSVIVSLLLAIAAAVTFVVAPPRHVDAGQVIGNTLLVKTLLCPSEVQAASDIAPDACPLAVLPADYPSIPDGYTTDLLSATYAYRLTAADSVVHFWPEFYLDGGGECDPGRMWCGFNFDYRLDGIPPGSTTLVLHTAPEGYRLGHADLFVQHPQTPSGLGGDFQAMSAPVTIDLAAQTISFDLTSPVSTVAAYLFADAEAASPTPAASVPNTAAPAQEGVESLSWLMQLMAVFFALSALGLVLRYGRRRAWRRLH